MFTFVTFLFLPLMLNFGPAHAVAPDSLQLSKSSPPFMEARKGNDKRRGGVIYQRPYAPYLYNYNRPGYYYHRYPYAYPYGYTFTYPYTYSNRPNRYDYKYGRRDYGRYDYNDYRYGYDPVTSIIIELLD